MQKKIIYFVIAFSCIAVSIVITEGIYFYIMLNRHPSTNKADVIVVFPGSADRIETGFQLLQHRQATSIFIPGIDESTYKRFAKRHKWEPKVDFIISEKTKSTFEDALIAKRIIRNLRFKSVILVTSFYHLPRSYFLLRSTLAGSGVEIQLYGVNNPGTDMKFKIVLLEMTKFWGSFFELCYYVITGGVIPDNAILRKVVGKLKA